MEIEKLLLFVPIALVYIAAPGPAVLLTVINGAQHGPRQTLYTIYGNSTGHLVTAGFSILGIHAIMTSSDQTFQMLKIFSIVFLVYKGIEALAKTSHVDQEMRGMEELIGESPNRNRLYMQGFLMSVLNPKPVLFFSAVFPQFISANYPPMPQLMRLTVLFMIVSFVCLTSYAVIAAQMRAWLSIPFWNNVFNKLAGTTFIAIGGIIGLTG